MKKHLSKLLLLSTIVLFVTTCQNENDFLVTDKNSIEQEKTNTRQAHLRAESIPSIIDFVNSETNYTRQVLIDKSNIKKAKKDYRNSYNNAKIESGFGYIDTSYALVVDSENYTSYTFKVVTSDLTNFINYIVVENKVTLEMYGYFMRYTPTEEWIESQLSLLAFSGTIEYFNENVSS